MYRQGAGAQHPLQDNSSEESRASPTLPSRFLQVRCQLCSGLACIRASGLYSVTRLRVSKETILSKKSDKSGG